MSEYSEYPVFGVTEITRGDDPTPVQLQVRTPDFTTTVVLTGMETRIGHTSYEGYEGNILTCPDETKGSGAIVSIDTLQVKRNRNLPKHIGRPAVGNLILIPRSEQEAAE